MKTTTRYRRAAPAVLVVRPLLGLIALLAFVGTVMSLILIPLAVLVVARARR